MMQSLFALPVSVMLVATLFLILFFATPARSKMAALVTALFSIVILFLYSLYNWPGADVLAMYVAVLSVTAYLLGIIANVWEKRRAEGSTETRWFHWEPTIIVMFFLTLFAADSVFVMVSSQGLSGPLAKRFLPEKAGDSTVSSTFPGVVSRNYQKKENAYNNFRQRMDSQHQRGWKVKKGWLGSVRAKQLAVFQVQVTDKDNTPLTGAQVEGIYMRPSDSRKDYEFTMIEKQDGIYQAEVTLPEPGSWSLALTVTKDDLRHELLGRTEVE